MLKRVMLLLALLLAVPAMGYVVADFVQSRDNSQLREIIREEFPDTPQERIGNITVDTLCSESSPEIEEICSDNGNLNLMRSASLWSAVIGIGMLLLIKLAGIVAKTNRTLLLVVFRPGLYVTALALVGLVLVHAALAIGIIYYGESALVNRVHVGLIAAIGIGAALGAFAIMRHTFTILAKAETVVVGTALSRNDAPRLWQAIDNTADRLGALVPDHAVVGLDPNFFVTEAAVVCLSGKLSGRTLYCSLPLARILNNEQFVAILGHELGHFKGEDTKFSERFYPIYRSTSSSLAALGRVSGDGAGGLALLPALAVFGYFLEAFSVAESRISRDRELEADRAGASVSSNSAIATALVKLHAFSGVWHHLQDAAVEHLRAGNYFINLSKQFATAVARMADSEALVGIANKHLSHPTDSHPPLGARLRSLGVKLSEVEAEALKVAPADSAFSLFDSAEEYEEDISARLQLHIANQLGISVPSADEVDDSDVVPVQAIG